MRYGVYIWGGGTTVEPFPPLFVNRRTDNTVPKGKRAKGQTTTYKTLHSSIKI